jgi:hypothetical protein
MDSNKLKAAIARGAESLKTPAKEGQTHSRQTADAHKKRKERTAELAKESYEVVADYLFSEGYANSFESALIVADVISDEWFSDILEATAATRATVRGRGRVPGASQRAVSREDRKAEAKARADERKAQLEAERKYAEERRNNPAILKKEAQKRTLSTRMERAAQRMGLQ